MPNTPNIPAGATADDSSDFTDIDGDHARALLWLVRHDTDKIGVAVDGWQTVDGASHPRRVAV